MLSDISSYMIYMIYDISSYIMLSDISIVMQKQQIMINTPTVKIKSSYSMTRGVTEGNKF